jgi:hypothetical protein
MSDSKETVHARMPHRNRLTTLGVGGQATSRSPFSLGDDNPPRPKPLPKHTDRPLDVSDLRQMPTCIVAIAPHICTALAAGRAGEPILEIGPRASGQWALDKDRINQMS